MATEKTTINRESDMYTGRRSIVDVIHVPGTAAGRKAIRTEKMWYAQVHQGEHEPGSANTRQEILPPYATAGDAG